MIKKIFLISISIFLYFGGFAQDQVNWSKINVLIYTKNGKGFVHDNIPHAVKAIMELGKKHGFKVDSSSNPAVMTKNNLDRYSLLVFPSTNNDIFNTNEQRLAFRRFIEAGGGFVGIHSVTGTERNWKWFKMMLGGTFAWHPKFQEFTVRVIDPEHPSMQGVPRAWKKADECYFAKELYPGPRAIMVHDLTTLDTSNAKQKELIEKNKGTFADYYPAAWVYDFDGGITWCTALGHDKKDYSDPVFINHILGGIQYVASRVKPLEYNKAYAKAFDEPVKFF